MMKPITTKLFIFKKCFMLLKKTKATDLFSSVIIKRGTLLNQIAINFLWIIVVQVKLLGKNAESVVIVETQQIDFNLIEFNFINKEDAVSK